MSKSYQFKEQERRNRTGFNVTCQVAALISMLSREKEQDSSHFEDLLAATLPRLHQLNEAAMALFSDENAFSDDVIATTVYGKDIAVEEAA